MCNVSVIIPVYNSEKYIKRCLDSILEQTYQDFEIIAVNDGSTDKSLEILKQYEKENAGKIKVIDQKNQGVAKTRNNAIKKANGKYIMFVDNDDYIDKDYIKTFVNEIEKDDLDIVIGGYRRPNSKGKIISSISLNNEPFSKYIVVAPWAKIYKKDFIINNDICFFEGNIGEDVYFNVIAYNLTNKLKVIDYIGYNWFYNEKSISNTIQKDISSLEIFELLNSLYNKLEKMGALENNLEEIQDYYIRYVIWILLFTCKKQDYKTISHYYEKLFCFLKEKFPNFKKSKIIKLSNPKGDIISTRLITTIVLLLDKIKLGKIAIFIYGKI